MGVRKNKPLRTARSGSRVQTARAVLTAVFAFQTLLPAGQVPGATEPAEVANTRQAGILRKPLGASAQTSPAARIARTPRSLVRNGAIYLSLNDALALAIENNLDVQVARYGVSIA